MKCKECNYKNREGGKFCASCGTILPVESFSKYRKNRDENAVFNPQKKSTNWFLNIFALIAIVIIILVIIVSFNKSYLKSSNSTTPTVANIIPNEWQPFTSEDNGFSALFPTSPNTLSDPKQTTTSYAAIDKNGTDFFIQSKDYNMLSKTYDNKSGLEDMLSVMKGSNFASFSDIQFSNFKGYDAMTFNFQGIKNKYLGQGIGIIRNDQPYIKTFLIMVGSASGDTSNYQKFINSLEFK